MNDKLDWEAVALNLAISLEGMLNKYTQLVNCGDCGNWDPEKETPVIHARKAMKIFTEKASASERL